jgi:formate dehydrogenase iron-sulfur subunit
VTSHRELDVVAEAPVDGPEPPRGLGRPTYPFRRPAPPPEQPTVGFFTDTTVCIGCKACEVACKEWNLLPADPSPGWRPSYDHTEALSATSWRHVKFVEVFDETPLPPPPVRDGGFDLVALLAEPKQGQWLMMSDSCKHCATAPCNLACPTGAIVHSEFGSVVIQPDICTGCGACVSACPFGVPAESDLDGHSHKCTLCYDRLHDDLTPACAKACPTQSIRFGPLEELREEAHRRVATLHERGHTSAYLYGIDESQRYSALHSFYLLTHPSPVYGLPEEPVDPWRTMAGDYGRALLGLLVAVATVLVVLGVAG